MSKRYWTCEVAFEGKASFLLSSADFYVEASSELEAEPILRAALVNAWNSIVPYPAPKMVSVIPGALVLSDGKAEVKK